MMIKKKKTNMASSNRCASAQRLNDGHKQTILLEIYNRIFSYLPLAVQKKRFENDFCCETMNNKIYIMYNPC